MGGGGGGEEGRGEEKGGGEGGLRHSIQSTCTCTSLTVSE